jgi:hypothetical protein
LPDPNLLELSTAFELVAPDAEVEEFVLDDFTPIATSDFGLKSSARPLGGAPTGLVGIGGQADGPAPLGPTDKKAGVGCSIQCITSGKAYARGVTSLLRVKTDTPATILIEVWNDNTYFSAESEPGVMQFEHHFATLLPDTTYQARATAVDSDGYESQGEGEFETLNRNVRITVPEAYVTESAFDQSDFYKFIWAEGEWIEAHEAGPLDLNGNLLDWGDNVILITDAPRLLEFAVQLAESNTEDDPQEVLALPDEDGPQNWWSSGQVWAYATLHDSDLDARPANATSWVEHTIYAFLTMGEDGGALPGGYGSQLEFHVPVVLEVFYD